MIHLSNSKLRRILISCISVREVISNDFYQREEMADKEKASVFRLRLRIDGRGGEIRTPNTRIWNPLLCQLELHPCCSCLMRRLSNKLAERTGLEPATPGVTGRYSNQLNYRSALVRLKSLNLKPGDVLLSHGETPHYHRRCFVSLLSSEWNQVGPKRYGRQANS